MKNPQKLIVTTKSFEGWSATPYKDSLGNWTIGWGFNIDEYGFPPRIARAIIKAGKVIITQAEGEYLLQFEISNSIKLAHRTFPLFDQFSEDRQIVIVDMIFNLGITKYLKFKRMVKAIRNQNWRVAAVEAQDSLWYTQVGDRSKRNVKVLATGTGL